MRLFLKTYKLLFPALSICLSLLSAVGCGYHFRPSGKPIGIQIQSLAIPLMESTSSTPGFEGDFTRCIREEFVSHAKIPLVSREKASAVLIGNVYEIKTEPYSYSLTQTTVQDQEVTYAVTNRRWLIVKMEARLVDNTTGKVIWEDKAMETKTTFAVGSDPLANRYYQRTAIKAVAKSFATMIYAKTMERF